MTANANDKAGHGPGADLLMPVFPVNEQTGKALTGEQPGFDADRGPRESSSVEDQLLFHGVVRNLCDSGLRCPPLQSYPVLCYELDQHQNSVLHGGMRKASSFVHRS
jgi:hypothetical protein